MLDLRWLSASATLVSIALLAVSALAAAEGDEVVGRAAPGWSISDWPQGGPVSFESLKGKVVLVRWWTGPQCPYCRASAPYLNAWHDSLSDEGLVIVGLYHHKSRAPLTREHVARLVSDLGFRFPVGIDEEWRVLKRWWLDGADRSFTSVSFLLDRAGIIQRVHRGGSYTKKEATEIESHIRALLATE
jgi:peroxiredoxin